MVLMVNLIQCDQPVDFALSVQLQVSVLLFKQQVVTILVGY